ncbi:hypothetical protein [Edaphocola flava]|jgi:hypothetical protein|uniref:hypothetical protein n=1 Tax=Edaphocola flava TaxID=2499629 RepID=UPI00100C311B|nr:hypothetical protein [Edaphocola flava]
MKSRETINRLRKRGIKQASTGKDAQNPAGNKPVQFSPKDIEAILIDVSLRELYNNGDRRDLDFVNEILTPNNISVSEGKALESFWDIITNSGLMKAVIGFGKNGKLTLTNDGYNLMNQFGSYMNYLNKMKAAGKGPLIDDEPQQDHPTPKTGDTDLIDGVQ